MPEPVTDKLKEPETTLVPEWQSRTLRADEMAELLRQAQESRPRPHPEAMPSADAERYADEEFETTIIMDRATLPRPNRTLRPEEFPDLPATAPINLRVEKTPAEFSHLYASLERQIAGVGDVTLISGETLGADRPYVLGITSAVGGEGKTTVALHLALTISRDTFKRVCLIDMSLGKGDLAVRIGVPARGEGVIPVLEDSANVVPTLQIAGADNLVVIPAAKRRRMPLGWPARRVSRS